MQVEINKDTYQLLFCLFQASALYETLEDFDGNQLFVKDLKQHTNNYKKKLRMSLVKYEIDPKDFETYDYVIQKSVKQFAHKGFKSFFKIED